jgi:hypothetical protein
LQREGENLDIGREIGQHIGNFAKFAFSAAMFG